MIRSTTLAVLALVCSAPASAALTVYTDLATFSAAVGGLTQPEIRGEFADEFEDGYSIPSPYQIGPLTFTGRLGLFQDAYASTYLLASTGAAVSTHLKAVGFGFASYYGGTINVFANGTLVESVFLQFHGESFIGFTDPNYVRNITFTNVGDGDGPPEVDFLNLYTSGAVPEPGTWALLFAGFAGIGAAMRRSRRLQSRNASS